MFWYWVGWADKSGKSAAKRELLRSEIIVAKEKGMKKTRPAKDV